VKKVSKLLFIILSLFFLASSCTKEKQGNIEINFTHTVDDKPVIFNELIYTNSAGNKYQMNEIKYFISKIYLINNDGNLVMIHQDDGIHYVDCSLSNTLIWKIYDIAATQYTGLSFVFGLDETDNKSNRFVNEPECNFSWPNHLGGGYHYMQINGKFINKEDELQNMNIHTGIGQIYNENDEVVQFVHNYFIVNLPVNFNVELNQTTSITLNMEIQRWFDTPNIYNFDDFGTGIMQNQNAQKLLKENGGNVFLRSF